MTLARLTVFYIVMAHVFGASLRPESRCPLYSGPQDCETGRERPACAHAAQVIHRDIKAANIIVGARPARIDHRFRRRATRRRVAHLDRHDPRSARVRVIGAAARSRARRAYRHLLARCHPLRSRSRTASLQLARASASWASCSRWCATSHYRHTRSIPSCPLSWRTSSCARPRRTGSSGLRRASQFAAGLPRLGDKARITAPRHFPAHGPLQLVVSAEHLN